MKKNYLLFVGVLVSTFALASVPGSPEPSGLAVVKKNETTFNLLYQSAGLSNVKVSILDAKGNEVFSESIKKTDGFIRPYNFSEMGKGDYTFCVEDKNGRITETFQYGLAEPPKAATVLQLADNKYIVGVKSALASGSITIKIYEGSRLLHEQQNEIASDFGQLFTLKNITDAVSFEITDSKGNKIN
jgi:hypothetical protein